MLRSVPISPNPAESEVSNITELYEKLTGVGDVVDKPPNMPTPSYTDTVVFGSTVNGIGFGPRHSPYSYY